MAPLVDLDKGAGSDADSLDEPLHPLVEKNLEGVDQPSGTLLPGTLATAVSLATRSSSLAVRVGTLIGSYGFDAARLTTLSSLELGRGVIEGILCRAGTDMVIRSQSDLARADAETILEKSLENLHHAMSQMVFWTTAGFKVTEATFNTFSGVSQLLLSSLDEIFGSTESSRAIASIITLIRREFTNPITGAGAQQVGSWDLVVGLAGLACLQRICWRLQDEESRRLGHEEIVWDVVVLNDGERIDVHEDSLYGVHKGKYTRKGRGPGILTSNPGPSAASPAIMAALESHGTSEENQVDEENPTPESRLHEQILQTLPSHTNVSITTSVVTQKTITVEFSGPEAPLLSPPPGIEIIEREMLPSPHDTSTEDHCTPSGPTHRVVFKVDRTRTVSRACQGHAGKPEERSTPQVVESVDSSEESDISPPLSPASFQSPLSPAAVPPPVPPKAPSTASSQTSLKTTVKSPERKTTLPVTNRSKKPPKASHVSNENRAGPSSKLPSPVNAPNQKRQRAPLAPIGTKPKKEATRSNTSISQKLLSAKSKDTIKSGDSGSEEKLQKKSGLRQALKRTPGSNLSSLWNKDAAAFGSMTSLGKDKDAVKSPAQDRSVRPPSGPVLRAPPSRATGPTVASSLRDRGVGPDPTPVPRSASRASFISIHEQRRDSLVSQTDTYSIHSVENLRPDSPLFVRREARQPSNGATPGLSDQQLEHDDLFRQQHSPGSIRNRRLPHRAHTPSLSLYSIKTSGSQASLVLSSMHPKSAYTDAEAIDTLRRNGTLNGIFPAYHLLRNVTRFMLYSSAAYGSNFLKVMGISKDMPVLGGMGHANPEIRSFAHHTESSTDSILLASFVDPQGGSDTTGATGTGVPLVHYISLDHESKAVVLACRGTLGFEDVLADMACDYDDLNWRGKPYKVHKGVHASARRLLYGGDGRVLYTLREALEEFTDYGLVLCGHSLGGAVTALLGTMLAEPSPTGTGFVTSSEPHQRLLTAGSGMTPGDSGMSHVYLPSGRPLHVYAYGPPGTMSPSLRKATRGLITSTIQGSDLVPFLSLGVLHDFRAVALAFKSEETSDARVQVKELIWSLLVNGLTEKWYAALPSQEYANDPRFLATLTTLRSGMMNPKLVPPGEVFVVESSRVLRRDAFLLSDEQDLGRPAQRVVFKYVRDVESRFREVRFGTSILMDHSPAKYEEALRKLRLGVADAR